MQVQYFSVGFVFNTQYNVAIYSYSLSVGQLVHLYSKVKHLKSYCMDCRLIWFR